MPKKNSACHELYYLFFFEADAFFAGFFLDVFFVTFFVAFFLGFACFFRAELTSVTSTPQQ